MKERIFTKDFVLLIGANFFIAAVMYSLSTTIAEYAQSYGATSTLAGVVTGIYTIGALMTRLGSSGWMKKLGWKKLTRAFTWAHFAACLLYFAAFNMPILILVRFIHGLTFGASASLIMTIGMSMVPKSRYGEGSGYMLMGPALAMAVGPYISGYIMDTFGGTGCFTMASVCAFLTALFVYVADYSKVDPGRRTDCTEENVERRPKAASGIKAFIEPKVIPVAFCCLLLVIGYSGIISFIRPFGSSIDLNTSTIFLIYAVILLVIRPFAGRLQDRKGDNAVVYPGIILQAAGLALMAWKPCMVTIVLAAFGAAMGFGNLSACIQAIAVRMTSEERRPYAINTFWICCDGGMGIGPMILGAVVTAGGYNAMYFAGALISLAALPLYYISCGRRK